MNPTWRFSISISYKHSVNLTFSLFLSYSTSPVMIVTVRSFLCPTISFQISSEA